MFEGYNQTTSVSESRIRAMARHIHRSEAEIIFPKGVPAMKPQYLLDWSVNEHDCLPGWTVYVYTELHIPSGMEISRRVYCSTREIFLELLNEWNGSHSPDTFMWKYFA